MRRDRAALLSYLAAAVIACLTLFVFSVLQYYGPESALRRLHTVTDRVDRYTPPNVPFTQIALQTRDAFEYSTILKSGANKENLNKVMDGIVRTKLYQNARYTILRTDYKTPRLALVVVEYELPRGGEPDLVLFVLQKPRRSWLIDVDETAKVWDFMRPINESRLGQLSARSRLALLK